MKSEKVAIDLPTPGYKYTNAISISYPKTPGAEVVPLQNGNDIEQYVGPGEVSQLYTPGADDYKTKTGELFIFGGSHKFHGAPLMSVMGASKLVGSVYFYTTPGNRELVHDIKTKVYEFITVEDNEIEKYAEYADVFLFGPGLEDNLINRALIKELFELYPDKPKVIDAYAIAMVPKDELKNCILTPHRGELRHIWGTQTNYRTQRLESNLRRFAKDTGAIVVLKGHIDMIFNTDGEVKLNKTGNPGMAKGGTGDILAGIVASFACKNDLWLAAQAGTFINGLAGDLAHKEFGYNYSATDIVPFIQKGIKWCEDLASDI